MLGLTLSFIFLKPFFAKRYPSLENIEDLKLFSNNSVTNFDVPSAVFNAMFPEKPSVTITFENVLPGEYAILALHDENDNKRMDYEDNGMPKESFGMSNNVMVMGPPQYEDAKFKVANEDLDLNIRF